MVYKHPALLGFLAAATLVLAACGSAEPAQVPPARIITVTGSHVPELQLTGRAVQRLGITTQPVRAAAGPGVREVVPYSAVVYDTDGSAWAYVNTASRVYRRAAIAVAEVQGDVALLSSGPPVGAAVVTVGAAELLGTEYNISGEE
jgi:hypothetical protein